MFDRIIGAFTFRKGVYAEVERDETFTQSAWLLVAVVAFLNALGSTASTAASGNFGGWIIGSIITTVFALIGFALAAFIISLVGKTVFSADVNFGEMVRVLGLAYVWNIIGFLGILSIVSAGLVCILSPVTIIAAIAGFIAWLIAAKEALDLEWIQTIIVLVIGWIVNFVVMAIAGLIMAALGFAAAGIGGALAR